MRSADASLVYAEGGDGSARARLGEGATAPRDAGRNGTLVVFGLSDGDMRAIAAANESAPPVRLDIDAGAVRDLAGNAFAGAMDVPLRVTRDGTPPRLVDSPPPELDLNRGALRMQFTEPIAPDLDLRRISLAGPSGAAPPVRLGGASVVLESPDTAVVALTAAQKAAVVVAYIRDGGSGPVLLGVGQGAVMDEADNGIAEVAGIAVRVVSGHDSAGAGRRRAAQPGPGGRRALGAVRRARGPGRNDAGPAVAGGARRWRQRRQQQCGGCNTGHARRRRGSR